MTDFWFNHFNVFVGKGPERLLLTNYEQRRDSPARAGQIRRPARRDREESRDAVLSGQLAERGPEFHAGARNSRADDRALWSLRTPAPIPAAANPNAQRKQNNGLNENYGRELLELHTLSVNGGYSQRDVTEVAKVFTGWTIEKPFEGVGFSYEPRMHEPGPKFVLGHRIKPKGEDEGREVLHLLATSPQTAHFISLKLAQRFVSDDPPPALVDRMAKTFEKKKGDIREVLSTLFHSPEFWADSTYRAKVKTPLEFVASAVRATGADVDDAMPAGAPAQQHGHAALRGAASDRLFDEGRYLGEFVRAAEPHELRAGADRRQGPRREGRCRAISRRTACARRMRRPRLCPPWKRSCSPATFRSRRTIRSSRRLRLRQRRHERSRHERTRSQDKQDRKPTVRTPDTIAGLLLGSPEFQKR